MCNPDELTWGYSTVIVVVVYVKRQEFNHSRRAHGYFTVVVTRLNLPHAYVVTLISETAGSVDA